MSDTAAHLALMRLNMAAVAIDENFGGFSSAMTLMARSDMAQEEEKRLARRGEMCEGFGFRDKPQNKPFAFAEGMAIIPVHGVLLNRFGGSYGFVTGYNFIRRQVQLAAADPDVEGIIFDIDSPGGEAAGCFELCADISEAAKAKPMLSVVDSSCYSAAYAIASATGNISVTPSGGAGSIGVLSMHVDMSKMLDDVGIKVTMFKFGEHKADGNPYEALSADAKKRYQESVDKSGEAFVALVAANRDMEPAKVKATEARTYKASDALSLGLIDTVAPPSQAVQVFRDELSGSTSTATSKESQMTTEAKPGNTTTAPNDQANTTVDAQALANQAAATARTEERARVSGILDCEEAKDRPAMAKHLATNTSMSVDEAKALLKVAAPEAKASTGNAFNAAMSSTANPQVGDGSGGSDEGENASAAKATEILRNFQTATGTQVPALLKKP